jgi:DNA-binding transcriptional LysR family regulator
LALGLSCVPLPLAMPDIRAGRLIPMLASFIRADLLVYLCYPNRKNLPCRPHSFVDFALYDLYRKVS